MAHCRMLLGLIVLAATSRCMTFNGHGSDPSKFPPAATERSQSPSLRPPVGEAPPADPAGTSVRLSVVHGVVLATGGPGFQLHVENWSSGGEISFYLVGPRGEQVPVVPIERHSVIDDTGRVVFHVPYALRDLYPGQWIGLVAGTSGIHQFNVEIPR
jgi:hypothetical protein